MQLYNIEKSDVINTIMAELKDESISSDKMEVVNQSLRSKYGFPSKVVFSKIRGKITIITPYPLRKERRS